MDNAYLQDLINEVKARDGGLILSMGGLPEVVVLSIEKYNQLLQGQARVSGEGETDLSAKQASVFDFGPGPKHILVTGGAGYIGAHVAKTLLQKGHRVIVLDNLSAGKLENVPPAAKFIEGDIRDGNLLRDIFGQEKIDAVMHFAAAIEVEESVRDPLKYFDNNVLGTAKLLEVMKEAEVKQIIFSSSCAIYDGQTGGLLGEQSAVGPASPYGFSKLLGEDIIKYYCEYLGFKAVVLRYFNACGFDPEGNIQPTHDSHLIAKVMEVAKGRKAFLTINGANYETPDGSCVRDYVHVLDIAQAHTKALTALETGVAFKVYNIGTGRGLSVLEVANAAAEILNKMIPMEIGPKRAGDLPITVADNSKMKLELGFEPTHSDLATILKTSWKQISQE
jgi:UDP-glucose 4-epimerase